MWLLKRLMINKVWWRLMTHSTSVILHQYGYFYAFPQFFESHHGMPAISWICNFTNKPTILCSNQSVVSKLALRMNKLNWNLQILGTMPISFLTNRKIPNLKISNKVAKKVRTKTLLVCFHLRCWRKWAIFLKVSKYQLFASWNLISSISLNFLENKLRLALELERKLCL